MAYISYCATLKGKMNKPFRRESKNNLPFDVRLKTHDHLFITNTHIPELARDMKNDCKSFPFWAYIDHEPDDEIGSPHTHFFVQSSGSMTLATVARRLGIEANFVQFVDNPRSCLRYLVHADNPEKKQYRLEDVVTNQPARIESALNDSVDDPFALFRDLDALRFGRLSRQEFILKHKTDILRLNFQSRLKVYSHICTLEEYGLYSQRQYENQRAPVARAPDDSRTVGGCTDTTPIIST